MLRAGRVTEAQSAALETLLPQYGLNEQARIHSEGRGVFSTPAPLWLEIGFGNGELLTSLALAKSDINFIGAEVHRPGVGRLLQNIQNHSLDNVRVLVDDAVQFLLQQVDDHSLQRVLLMFPDPWHKKRHHKRRIVNREFADLLIKKLVPGGVFHAATDWQGYAEHMLEVLEPHAGFTNLAGSKLYSSPPDYRIETRFEKRGKALGHGVWDLLYKSDDGI